jgi:site-specific DNA-methyltransferase (adenine-specific)
MDNYRVVAPTEIILPEDMPRFRKEMGKIKELVESFKRFGQLQPCVVNRDMKLVAGGRRLAACIEAGLDVKIVFVDTVNPLELREMELEENIQRKAFTPAEEIMAVQELHNLKREIYGEPVQGSDKGTGWRLDDTAQVIGKTRASVIGDLALAQALKDFPELANCKTKSDIKRAVKGLERISASIQALDTYDAVMKDKEDKFEIHNVDCLEYMLTMEDKCVDVLLTDPPYGIDIHDITIGLGGHTGSDVTMSGFKYEDWFEESMLLINNVAKESSRIVKDTGFAVVFCAISNFWIIRSMFEAAGWNCSQRPIIWIKNESGQNNAPSKWMSAGYESMLFARKLDSRIVIEGKVDWIQCPNVTPSIRIHQAEKPVALLKELLSRLAMPGSVVFDPFAGSMASVEAAIEMKMYPIGCEKLVEAFAVGKQRTTNYFNMKGE